MRRWLEVRVCAGNRPYAPIVGGGRGIRTHGDAERLTGFQDRRHRPLGEPSSGTTLSVPDRRSAKGVTHVRDVVRGVGRRRVGERETVTFRTPAPRCVAKGRE